MAVRLQLYGLASTAAFVVTVLNAFRQRPNFYSAAVYLSKSSACKMVLWNQAVFQTILLGKVFQKVFFGNLRMIEVEVRSRPSRGECMLKGATAPSGTKLVRYHRDIARFDHLQRRI